MEEEIRFMYDKVYDELNRCRDWPLKILGITSGLYITILAFLLTFADQFKISSSAKWILFIVICIFWIFCLWILGIQHLRYLDYRNIQIRLQNQMGVQNWTVGGKRTIPKEWDRELSVGLWTNWQGWIFYAFFISCLSGFSIYVICKL